MELNLKQRANTSQLRKRSQEPAEPRVMARVAAGRTTIGDTAPLCCVFRDAREEAVDNLAAEIWRRAVQGVEVPVFYQRQMCYQKEFDPQTGQMRTTRKPLTIRRYSDTLLMFLANAEMPEKYRDNWTGGRRSDELVRPRQR